MIAYTTYVLQTKTTKVCFFLCSFQMSIWSISNGVEFLPWWCMRKEKGKWNTGDGSRISRVTLSSSISKKGEWEYVSIGVFKTIAFRPRDTLSLQRTDSFIHRYISETQFDVKFTDSTWNITNQIKAVKNAGGLRDVLFPSPPSYTAQQTFVPKLRSGAQVCLFVFSTCTQIDTY